MSETKDALLVTPQWLHERREDAGLVIVDCAFDPAAYGRAHVPGAAHRAGHPYVKQEDDQGVPGRFLPRPDAFAALTGKLGIGKGSLVVAYDDRGSLFAARFWWMLRYYGHERVCLLDGGWQAWVDAGLPVSYRKTEARPPDQALDPEPDPARLATLEELRERHAAGDWRFLDVRSVDEYEGRAAHGNARTGRVPGAIHLEWNRFLENSQDAEAVRRFRSAQEIVALLEQTGVARDKTVVTYCQAGIRAALGAFALELAGYPPARLYDGSMAEWANRDETPLE